MSDDEIRQQKAMLLLEHQEAQERLAALQEKAIRIGRALRQFGEWLEKEPGKKIYVSRQDQYGLKVDLLDKDEPLYREALSLDAALDLADEIRKATAIEKDLADRLRRHP